MGRLYTAVAQDRIPIRNANALARIGRILLNTIPGIKSEFPFSYKFEEWNKMLDATKPLPTPSFPHPRSSHPPFPHSPNPSFRLPRAWRGAKRGPLPLRAVFAKRPPPLRAVCARRI